MLQQQDYQKEWAAIEILDLSNVLTRRWSAAKIIKPRAEVDQYV
jgi:hypothetical protein